MKPTTLELLQNFDKLPADALLSQKPTAIILGISERQLRQAPPIPKIKVGIRSVRYRVGDVRRLARGEIQAA